MTQFVAAGKSNLGRGAKPDDVRRLFKVDQAARICPRNQPVLVRAQFAKITHSVGVRRPWEAIDDGDFSTHWLQYVYKFETTVGVPCIVTQPEKHCYGSHPGVRKPDVRLRVPDRDIEAQAQPIQECRMFLILKNGRGQNEGDATVWLQPRRCEEDEPRRKVDVIWHACG